MQCRRIEIGAVRPRQRTHFLIESHGVEHGQVPQWTEECALQHRPEVDLLGGSVREGHRQRVRTDDVELRDAMDGMGHGLPEWFDLDRRLARLQEIPIALQFLSVNLRPGLHEPPLRLGHTAAEAFDRVHGKDRRLVGRTSTK